MADIRKREYKSGSKYQVRHPSSSTKSGYAYKTFDTLKEARAFLESGKALDIGSAVDNAITRVPDAIERWLEICEKEGTDGNDPVTSHTLETYRYFSGFMCAHPWAKPLQELMPPDIVKFRSWLMENCPSRYIARRSLTYFHTVLKEMALRGGKVTLKWPGLPGQRQLAGFFLEWRPNRGNKLHRRQIVLVL